jgi:DNA helicase II / ATP-dependent DNA helicase PcrA
MPIDHLAKLNPEQRRAVEHCVGSEAGGLAAPLLVIAGAGTGKTNTLAHRVANLIVNGVDPRRILLMTFSRRAASEMSRRVESICAKLLREYAEQIGLQPNFTIHGSSAESGWSSWRPLFDAGHPDHAQRRARRRVRSAAGRVGGAY